jgi:hypothetical protein
MLGCNLASMATMKLHVVLVGVAFRCVVADAQVAAQSAAPSCDVLVRDIQGNTNLHVGERVAYFGSPVMPLRADLGNGNKTVMRTFECKTKEGKVVPDGRFTFLESNIERGAADLKPANDGTLYIVEGIVKSVTRFTETTSGQKFVLPLLEKVVVALPGKTP